MVRFCKSELGALTVLKGESLAPVLWASAAEELKDVLKKPG